MNYIFVVMKNGGPDFFGEVSASGTESTVVVANPVAVQYQNMVPEFVTDFMPIGMHLQYSAEKPNMVAIPMENVIYVAFLQENETMAVAYREFLERYTSSTASTN